MMKKNQSSLLVVMLVLFSGLSIAFVSTLRSPSPNALSIDDIADSHGVLREQRLFDGKLPVPGSPINDFVATLFLTDDSFVLLDLGTPRTLRYLQLNSLGGALGVWLSDDGSTFSAIDLEMTRVDGYSISRFISTEGRRTRYLRLARARATGAQGAAFEFTALSELPRQIPLAHDVQHPPTYESSLDSEFRRLRWIRVAKIAIGLAFGSVFFFIRRRRPPIRLCACCFFFVVAVFAWFLFQNPLQQLHGWEVTHYYLGPKYYKEMGHKELYKEIARHEVRQGRGQLLDTSVIRDLETNELHPGRVALDPGFTTDTTLGPSRSEQFSDDVDRIRRLFKYRHLQKIMQDHGYNGTPLFTTVFGGLFQTLEPRRSVLTAVALADILFVLGGLAAIWLTFGPRASCLAALVVGLGEPWAFTWTGGSIGRYLWFFLACSGLGLIRKHRTFAGAFALGMAGLLRLFPLVFLAGLGGVAAYRLVRREESKKNLSLILGLASALLLGLAIPILFHSMEIYREFLANIRLHSGNLSHNRIGLGALLDLWNPQRSPAIDWLAWAFGFSGFFVLCGRIVTHRLALWHAFVASGFLLYFISPLSSYDYVWLACLAPACVGSRFRTALFVAMLVSFNALTAFSFGFVPEILMNVVASAALALFFMSYGHSPR